MTNNDTGMSAPAEDRTPSETDAPQAMRDAAWGLRWALDILDMYDERLVQLGDPRDRVYSAVHVRAKRRAREAVDAAHAIVARLTAALDRVRDDAARLDWLEREVERLEEVRLEFTEAGSEAGECGSVLSSWPRGFWINDGDEQAHSTLREAVDAARARPASEPPAGDER